MEKMFIKNSYYDAEASKINDISTVNYKRKLGTYYENPYALNTKRAHDTESKFSNRSVRVSTDGSKAKMLELIRNLNK